MHIRRWIAATFAALVGHAAAQTAPAPTPPAPQVTESPQTAPEPAPVAGAALVGVTVQMPVPNPDAPAAALDDPQFPHLVVLTPAVTFWTRVFSEWSENQSVMHSTEDLRRVYTVLDFRAEAAVLTPAALAALKSRDEKQAYTDLNTRLNQLQALLDQPGGIDPETLTAEQRKVYDLFDDSRDQQRFRNALGTFRFQRGLRERTQHALETSGRYLPEMERIFTGYSLPTKLTRLPLVESSFNVDAYSKAAAAGLWQFIPSSARIYMRLNDLVDDRRDPWLSTDAAARHLKDDYAALGNWPLALTAYNYGRGGLARALTEVNGTTLTDVLERYQGRRFGFASSNFYAEFLAASDVEGEYRKHFGDITREPALVFETVSTRDYVPFETLRKLCGTDEEEFRRLNPAYRPEVIAGRLYVPPGHSIRVPAGAAERFRLAYATLTPDQRFDHQRQFYSTHLVARGESAGKLARRYGVSVAQILAANGLSSSRKVRAGQTLKIPVHDAGERVATAAEATSAAAAPVAGKAARTERTVARAIQVRTHRVKSGQTLGALARRYQTTIHSLRELNGFGDSDVLRVGSTIKVPNG